MIGIVLFAAGSLGVFLAFDWPPLVELLVLSLLLSVIAVRAINTVAVFFLCPRVAALRPLPIETPVARFVYRWSMGIALVACIGALMGAALQEMALVPDIGVIVNTGTGTLVAVLVLGTVWHWHHWSARVRRITQHSPAGAFSTSSPYAKPSSAVRTKSIAPMAATVCVLVAWALWLVGAYPMMWTLIIAVLVYLADRGGRALITSLHRWLEGTTGPD